MNTRAAAGKVKRRAKADRDYSSYETGQIHKQFERLIKKCSKNGDPTKPDFYAILWAVSQMFGKEVQNFYKKGHYDTDSYRLACYSACTFLGMTPYRIALLLNINTLMAGRYINSIERDLPDRTTFTRVRLVKEHLERLKGRPPELHMEKSFDGKGFHRKRGNYERA